MQQYERNGITVDQCVECRGIFLDRGELERLVDAENSWHGDQPAGGTVPAPPPPPPPGQQPYSGGYDRSPGSYKPWSGRGGYSRGGQPRKRRSFLEDLFD